MTPEQAARQQRIELYSAAAYNNSLADLSWTAHGGLKAGLTQIYLARLGRAPEPTAFTSWGKHVAAATATWDQVDAAVASSEEAKARGKA